MGKNHILVDRNILSTVEKFLNRPMGGIILSGPKGLGKHLIACQMAVRLLGVDSEGDIKNHPDFVEISSKEGVIKMEDLEPIRKSVAYSAINAERKVFIIDDAELMTPNAQNSLLKLLEDMYEKNVVILVCHAPVLRTVSSRCHVVEFFPQTEERMVKYMKENNVPVNEIALAIANGCIGQYFAFYDRNNYLLDVRNFFSVLPRDDTKELLISLSLIKEKDPNNFFEKYSMDDVRTFLTLLYEVLTEMLIQATLEPSMRKKYGFIDFSTAIKNFSTSKISSCLDLLRQHMLRTEKKGAYTKNDFFDLIRHL